jgi:hypothetical protein
MRKGPSDLVNRKWETMQRWKDKRIKRRWLYHKVKKCLTVSFLFVSVHRRVSDAKSRNSIPLILLFAFFVLFSLHWFFFVCFDLIFWGGVTLFHRIISINTILFIQPSAKIKNGQSRNIHKKTSLKMRKGPSDLVNRKWETPFRIFKLVFLCIFLDCPFLIFAEGWINNIVLIDIILWKSVKVHM